MKFFRFDKKGIRGICFQHPRQIPRIYLQIKFFINEFLKVFQIIPFGTCSKLKNVRFGQIFFNFMILEKFARKFLNSQEDKWNIKTYSRINFKATIKDLECLKRILINSRRSLIKVNYLMNLIKSLIHGHNYEYPTWP